jgi:site-specific recombinase XerD
MTQLSLNQHNFLQGLTEQGKSVNTIKNYKADLSIFNKFLIKQQQSLEFKQFTSHQAQEFAHYLERHYTASNSIRRRIQTLRLYFDYLVSMNLMHSNPIKKVASAPKFLDHPKPIAFHLIQKAVSELEAEIKSKDSLQKLIPLRNLVIIHLIYGAGLKVSDLEKLKKGHINLSKTNPRVLITPNKRDPYSVPLMNSSIKLITKYLKLRELLQKTTRDEPLLFNANAYQIMSSGMSARGIELVFKQYARAFGEGFNAKNLRQACIIRWLLQDKSITNIKEWMGVEPNYSMSLYQNYFKQKYKELIYLEL